MNSYFHGIKNFFCHLSFLPPLAFRLYLVPIFWMAGIKKWNNIEPTIAWFSNSDWGLGLPFPTILAYAATLTEIMGAVFLLVGFATRIISIPLMVVMAVAVFAVHWGSGWAVVAASDTVAHIRLEEVMSWLQTSHPDQYLTLTEYGTPVILNNGIEFAVTYFLILLSLFFTGPGRYFSIDYWIARRVCKGHCC